MARGPVHIFGGARALASVSRYRCCRRMIIPVVSTENSQFGNQPIVSRPLRTTEYKEGQTPTEYVNIRKTEALSRSSRSAEAHHCRPARDVLQASFPGPSDAMLGPGEIYEDDIKQDVSLLGRREPQDMEQRIALACLNPFYSWLDMLKPVKGRP